MPLETASKLGLAEGALAERTDVLRSEASKLEELAKHVERQTPLGELYTRTYLEQEESVDPVLDLELKIIEAVAARYQTDFVDDISHEVIGRERSDLSLRLGTQQVFAFLKGHEGFQDFVSRLHESMDAQYALDKAH